MSIVSTIILIEDYDHEDRFRRHINAFTGTSQKGGFALCPADDDSVGGYKMAECGLWWAAVNHLDVEGLRRHLAAFEGTATGMVVVHTGVPVCGTEVVWHRDED